MTSERAIVQINDTDFEEYIRNAKEMEQLINAAEKSYKKIVQIRGCSVARYGRTRHIGWIRISKANKNKTL